MRVRQGRQDSGSERGVYSRAAAAVAAGVGVHKTREQEQEEEAMLVRWKTEEQVLTQNPGRSTARRGGGVIAESALFIALTQPGRQQGQQGQGPVALRPLGERDCLPSTPPRPLVLPQAQRQKRHRKAQKTTNRQTDAWRWVPANQGRCGLGDHSRFVDLRAR